MLFRIRGTVRLLPLLGGSVINTGTISCHRSSAGFLLLEQGRSSIPGSWPIGGPLEEPGGIYRAKKPLPLASHRWAPWVGQVVLNS